MHLVRKTNGKIVGPWECEQCKHKSQFAEQHSDINYIFCRNPNCDFQRIVDKRRHHVVENDGTVWQYDGEGNKYRIRAQA